MSALRHTCNNTGLDGSKNLCLACRAEARLPALGVVDRTPKVRDRSMVLVVRTGCLKSAARLRDDALDVTRGTGHGNALAFAPSTGLLAWVKGEERAGRLERAWPEYRTRYRAEMAESRDLVPQAWARLLARGSVTLLCYCGGGGVRCHRSLLARELVELGATYEGEVVDE